MYYWVIIYVKTLLPPCQGHYRPWRPSRTFSLCDRGWFCCRILL